MIVLGHSSRVGCRPSLDTATPRPVEDSEKYEGSKQDEKMAAECVKG